MSDYGADENPSIPAAQDLAWTKRFMPLKKTNVVQWTYPDDVIVRKLAHRKTGSNCLFKFAPPPPPPVIPPDLPPVPAGNACSVCWGNGKPFGVGETPVSITVVFQNIEKGPDWHPFFGEPLNGTFLLAQFFIVPCIFNLIDDDFTVGVDFDPRITFISLFRVGVVVPYFEATGIPCQTFFENTVDSFFTGGTATVFIPPIS